MIALVTLKLKKARKNKYRFLKKNITSKKNEPYTIKSSSLIEEILILILFRSNKSWTPSGFEIKPTKTGIVPKLKVSTKDASINKNNKQITDIFNLLGKYLNNDVR